MKLRYATLLTICLLFYVGGEVAAQPTITYTPLKNTNWGQIINCSCSEQLLLQDTGTGEVLIDAGKNRDVEVTITYPSVLNEEGGSDTIDYSTPKAAYNVGSNDKSTATQFSGDQSTEVITTSSGNTGGDIYIYIYGDITLNFPNAGSYSNTITVSAAYL
jgi:hypothetical protein